MKTENLPEANGAENSPLNGGDVESPARDEVEDRLLELRPLQGPPDSASTRSRVCLLAIAVATAAIVFVVASGRSGVASARPASALRMEELPPEIGEPPAMSAHLNKYFDTVVGEDENSEWQQEGEEEYPEEDQCVAGEEKYGALCYKSCGILTGNTHPIRTSAFTCCRKRPCGLWNTVHDVGFCSGFSVSGFDNGCPHRPGACLENEEMWMGLCFIRCTELTNGEKPHRVSAVTCCDEEGLGCFSFEHADSSPSYAASGGKGDGDPGTPSMVHYPMKTNLDEVQLV